MGIVHVILLMEEILHQLMGSLSYYLQGSIHVRWCRISSTNSMLVFLVWILKDFCPGKLLAKHVGIFPTFFTLPFPGGWDEFGFMRGLMYLCVNSLKPDEFAL